MVRGFPPGNPESLAIVPSVSSRLQYITGAGRFEEVGENVGELEEVTELEQVL